MTSQSDENPEVRPVDSPASELVVEHVRRLILNGDLQRGVQLPGERELVRSLGVSRSSVRGGLRALVGKGVLVTRHGAGTFVADGPPVLDSEPLSLLAALHGFTRAEMFEARRTLEVGVAGLAAERARGEDLAAISEEVTGMFASIDDPQAFLVHDIRFHRSVATASANPILASIVEMVSTLFYEERRKTANLSADPRSVAQMHRRIYHAIRDRDRAQAQELMFEHLTRAEREAEREQETRHVAGQSGKGETYE
jgi:GntR family transcriptional repressor for pyruvate dehydrogenase complex